LPLLSSRHFGAKFGAKFGGDGCRSINPFPTNKAESLTLPVIFFLLKPWKSLPLKFKSMALSMFALIMFLHLPQVVTALLWLLIVVGFLLEM